MHKRLNKAVCCAMCIQLSAGLVVKSNYTCVTLTNVACVSVKCLPINCAAFPTSLYIQLLTTCWMSYTMAKSKLSSVAAGSSMVPSIQCCSCSVIIKGADIPSGHIHSYGS